MKNYFNSELITSYIDDEINNLEKNEVIDLIKNNPEYQFEFKSISATKKSIRTRDLKYQTPNFVRDRILTSLYSEPINQKSLFAELIELLSLRPILAFSSFLVIILSIYLFSVNYLNENLFESQSGNQNMYVQAESNFKKILAGELAPQIVTSDIDAIKSLFSSNGVKYDAQIPQFTEWNLFGAVVSEDNGEKFAHHVYVCPSGKNIVYVYQVNLECVTKNKTIELTENFLNALNRGEILVESKNGIVTLFKKSASNIIAVVSNDSPEIIQKNFASL